MKKLSIILIFSSLFNLAFGQEKKEDPPDSSKIYKDVEKIAKKGKATYWLFKEIFNMPEKQRPQIVKREVESFKGAKGKVIRNIHVITLDPFGYSVHDTSRSPKSFLLKGGNFLHQRSVRFSIINQLLFREGDRLDPLKVKESERIIRSASHVREVVIYTDDLGQKSDSVDIIIREQDYWSKGISFDINDDKFAITLSDKNFLGFAHNIRHTTTYDKNTHKYYFSGTYSIPSLWHSLIFPTVSYDANPDNFSRGFSITRPFISPLIKWAGSIDVFDKKTSTTEIGPETDTIFSSTRSFEKDFWLARSFLISDDSTDRARSTRFIIGSRYQIVNFNYHPVGLEIPQGFYEDKKLFLVGIGLSERTYYRDNYIFRFGVQEDVPAGRKIGLTIGYESKETLFRTYAGIEAGTGNYISNFGYASLRVSLGSYFNKAIAEQSLFNIGAGYFSNLIKLNKTSFRQFAKLNLSYGFNRFRYEAFSFNDDIKGLDTKTLTGVKKVVLSLQTQAYLPFQVLGFYFAPFFFLNAGFISDDQTPLTRNRLYQGYGIGIIVKNEFLVINTFQFSFGFYPFTPESNHALLKYNPVKSYDFTFEDFQIEKPSVLSF